LNAPAADDEPEEMIVDPVFPPHQEPALENAEVLQHVNENEEDALPANQSPEHNIQGQDEAPNVAVVLPVIDQPMENFLPHEIQDNELMNDDEIQQQIAKEANQVQDNQIIEQNLQVGFVLVEHGPSNVWNQPGPWAKFFQPKKNLGIPYVPVPVAWAKFFSSLLLSPEHFEQAKKILSNSNLLACISEEEKVNLYIPKKCPASPEEFALPLVFGKPDTSTTEKAEVGKNLSGMSGMTRKTAIVETEVRRSPRIKTCKKGYKDIVCKDKDCLGCSSAPPNLSTKAIRKLGSSLCDLDTLQVTDEVLTKKAKVSAPGRRKASTNDQEKQEKKKMVTMKKKKTPLLEMEPSEESANPDED